MKQNIVNLTANLPEEKKKRKIKVAKYVKRLKKQQILFTKQLTFQNSATKASFIVTYNLAKRNKPFWRVY